MKFNRDLVVFDKDNVIYNGIEIGLTRQNIFDYVTQTEFSSDDLILYHYKMTISKIREEKLKKILDDRQNQNQKH